MLLTLLIFMFGVVGIHLFAGMQHGVSGDDPINDYHNFDNIFGSMKILFEISTAADWYLSYTITITEKLENTDWGVPALVFPYFCTYYVMSIYVFMNLFIAILLENFESSFDDDGLDVNQTHIDEVREQWIHHIEMCNAEDTSDSETEDEKPEIDFREMPLHQIRALVEGLDGPLSSLKEDTYWYNNLLHQMGFDTDNQHANRNAMVGFHDWINALAILHLSTSYLPFEEQVRTTDTKLRKNEQVANRIILAGLRAWLTIHRAPHNWDDAKLRAYKDAVHCCRDVMISTICKIGKLKKENGTSPRLDDLVDLHRKLDQGTQIIDLNTKDSFTNTAKGFSKLL